jgi:hypothetical protein
MIRPPPISTHGVAAAAEDVYTSQVVGEGGRRVENLDLSELVPGHLSYPKALPNIMALLRLEG